MLRHPLPTAPPRRTTATSHSCCAPIHYCVQVLLNVLADEIHRAHQRCLLEDECDPNRVRLAEWRHGGPAFLWAGRRGGAGKVVIASAHSAGMDS